MTHIIHTMQPTVKWLTVGQDISETILMYGQFDSRKI